MDIENHNMKTDINRFRERQKSIKRTNLDRCRQNTISNVKDSKICVDNGELMKLRKLEKIKNLEDSMSE